MFKYNENNMINKLLNKSYDKSEYGNITIKEIVKLKTQSVVMCCYA